MKTQEKRDENLLCEAQVFEHELDKTDVTSSEMYEKFDNIVWYNVKVGIRDTYKKYWHDMSGSIIGY